MQQDVQASLLGFMSAGTGQHKTGKNGGVVSSGQGDCRSPTEENGKVSPPSSCALEIKPIKVDPDLPFINESGDRRSYDLNKEKRNSRGKRANSSDQRPSSQRMLLSEPISRTSSIDKDIDQRMVWRDTDQKRASVWACTSCSSLNESGEGICKSCGVGKFSKH